MDDPSIPVSEQNSEIAHVTQEMYKKNFELAEKNKILSLLQKIEEIILSSVTDIYQIAQNVADVTSSAAEFKVVGIYLLDNSSSSLKLLAVSRTEIGEKIKLSLGKNIYPEVIKLDNSENCVVKVVSSKSKQTVNNLRCILIPYTPEEDIQKIERIYPVKSTFINPLIVRERVIGVLIISISETEDSLSGYQIELINRLVSLIGIAIDNAFLYQKMQIVNIQLREVDKMKDEFFSIASHELRTPLTVIQGNTSILMDYFSAELKISSVRELVDDIFTSTVRLIKLVNEFLDMSRLEQGKLKFEFQSVDLPKLIMRVIKEDKALFDSKQVEIGYEGPEALNVFCDPDRIMQVVINLVSNAIKHTEKGKIIIMVGIEGNFVLVRVRDTGDGISFQNQKYLFQKFRQADGDILTRDSSRGAGLGLYISKLLLERMGGTIWIEGSEEGKGSTFAFKIPLEKAG